MDKSGFYTGMHEYKVKMGFAYNLDVRLPENQPGNQPGKRRSHRENHPFARNGRTEVPNGGTFRIGPQNDGQENGTG